MTAAGHVKLRRRSMRRPDCGPSAHPADIRPGLMGYLSPQATRLACLAASSWSFDLASGRLEQIAGVRIDDETIRRHGHAAATEVIRRRDAHPPRAAFAAAVGDAESLADGAFAPTRDGWVELKPARSQIRPRGEPAKVADRANRELPAPTAGVSYATTAGCRAFSGRWTGWAAGLGIDSTEEMTVLGDGAAWTWAAATGHSPGAEQVLDISHASHHIASAAAGPYGEGTDAAKEWLEDGRRRPMADGWPGLIDPIGGTPSQDRTASGQAALDGLISCMAKHTERVGDFGRLRTGRSIGSGAVEGLAQQMGRRLKVAGRGWCFKHPDGMAALIASVDTPGWADLWDRIAA